MPYSIEPRERRYVKGYGFMSFARNFSASKKSQSDEVNNEIPKERYISPKEKQKIIDESKLA